MRLERSVLRAILIWAFALTLWLSVASYRSFGGEQTIPEPCCVTEQASNPLTFKLELFTIKGVNVSFIYGIDGNPSRIAFNRETCS